MHEAKLKSHGFQLASYVTMFFGRNLIRVDARDCGNAFALSLRAMQTFVRRSVRAAAAMSQGYGSGLVVWPDWSGME
jgi:hypothetical protein